MNMNLLKALSYVMHGISEQIIKEHIILYIVLFIALIKMVGFLYDFIKKVIRKRKYINSGIGFIDKMDGIEFENLLLAHFQNLGYKGHTTPATNDYGADLVLNKDGETLVLQAKRWTNKVGITAVQQINGAKSHYKADRAIVITNNYFTKNAEISATENHVELWNRQKLIEIMSESQNKGKSDMAVAPDVSEVPIVCPLCGGQLVKRESKMYGAFLGCVNYPKCTYTRNGKGRIRL